jgi:hypothetical protein
MFPGSSKVCVQERRGTIASIGLHRLSDAREAALLHLDVALRADRLLEQPPDPLLRAVLTPDLPARRALPEGRPEEPAYLLPTPGAKAADHGVPLGFSSKCSSGRGRYPNELSSSRPPPRLALLTCEVIGNGDKSAHVARFYMVIHSSIVTALSPMRLVHRLAALGTNRRSRFFSRLDSSVGLLS